MVNTNYNEKDKQALLSIARCAHVREEYLLRLITANRIKTFIEQKLIDKRKCYNPAHHFTSYTLTQKGKRFMKNNYNFKNFQHTQSIEHDSIISDKYFELTEKERKSWRTETDIKLVLEKYSYLRKEGKEYSATDAFYVRSDGKKIGFEVVTSSYTKACIQAKRNCCQLLGLIYEERRG
ncbi:hypothetical protein GND98_017520 [Clostridium butyricum]|uniref:Uncharacterized protein n=1 Tax=Clostridium butyricum TaxID=1492 RepID=A0A6L9ESM6_CLOBU|nr:hypothetical protein [Clostridium butyricum]